MTTTNKSSRIQTDKVEKKEKAVLKSFTGTLYYTMLKDKQIKGEYPANAYIAQISVDKKTKEKLEFLGVQVLNKGNELGDFVRAKSKQFQPRVVSPEGAPYLSNVNDADADSIINEVPIIGNGSTAEVIVSLYDNRESNVKQGNGGRKCLGLREVRLTNLIPYTPNEAEPL